MAIYTQRPPQDINIAAHELLKSLHSAGDPLIRRLNAEAINQIGIQGPAPIYLLGTAEEKTDRIQQSAIFIGWRFLLWNEDEPSAILDMFERQSEESNGSGYALRNFAMGHLPRLLGHALVVAENEFSNVGECEVRLLDVPAVNQKAIWLLVADNHFFVPYLRSSKTGEDEQIDIDPDFEHRLGEELISKEQRNQ